MSPQMTSRQTYNVWMKPEQDHIVIYVRVGTPDGFDDLIVQLTTEDDILKVFVNEQQVAESDGETVKYG